MSCRYGGSILIEHSSKEKPYLLILGELNKEEKPSFSLIISSLLIILSVLLPSQTDEMVSEAIAI